MASRPRVRHTDVVRDVAEWDMNRYLRIAGQTPITRVVATAVLGFAGLALAGCASVGPTERMSQRLDLYQDVAQAPVKSFHFWQMYRWEPLGREHLAVWTRLDTAFLIEVQKPCSGLDFAHVVGLSSTQNRVYSRFDDVRFDDQRCRIAQIRPVDVAALKAAEKSVKH